MVWSVFIFTRFIQKKKGSSKGDLTNAGDFVLGGNEKEFPIEVKGKWLAKYQGHSLWSTAVQTCWITPHPMCSPL